jgi:uncharacterized protein
MAMSDQTVPAEGEAQSPFVHKCSTKSHKYLFDVNTSRMLRVPAVVWDIVEDFGTVSLPDLVAKYGGTYPASAISEAYDAIVAAREQGLLSSNRPKEISMPYEEEEIAEGLAARRESLTLVVTEQCNLRCTYCVYGGQYAHHRSHSPGKMSWDVARAAIDEYLAHSGQVAGRSVRFYGGEPLLNLPLIRQTVEYIEQERGQTNVQFSVTTNGLLLQGEAAEFLARHGFGISVSLDGPEHMHDRYRRQKDGSETWQQIVANLRLFLKEHPEYRQGGLRFHAVVAPPADLRELEEFFASFALFEQGMGLSVSSVSTTDTTLTDCLPFDSLGVDGYGALYERFLQNMKDGTLNEDQGQPALWVQRALFEKQIMGFYKRGYAGKASPRLPERLCTLPMCLPGVRRLYVQTDGSYYPCERVQETPAFQIGSVQEGVSPEKVHALLQTFVDVSKAECRTCWCVPICQAGCVVAVMKDGKPDCQARRKACESFLRTAHRTMVSVCEALEANPEALRYMDAIKYT